jgi:hypothetical protein
MANREADPKDVLARYEEALQQIAAGAPFPRVVARKILAPFDEHVAALTRLDASGTMAQRGPRDSAGVTREEGPMTPDEVNQLLYYCQQLRDHLAELRALLREVQRLLPLSDGASEALQYACASQIRQADELLACDLSRGQMARQVAIDRAVHDFAALCAELFRGTLTGEVEMTRRFAAGEIQAALAQYEAAIRRQWEP